MCGTGRVRWGEGVGRGGGAGGGEGRVYDN